MIKVIDYKKIDLTDREFEFYKQLIDRYSDGKKNGADYFRDLFETDNNGIITIIKPIKQIPWAILFFVQNVMINQKLRLNDRRLDDLEKIFKDKENMK